MIGCGFGKNLKYDFRSHILKGVPGRALCGGIIGYTNFVLYRK